MEMLSNVVVFVLFVLWLVSVKLENQKMEEVVEEVREPNVRYLSDLTFNEIVDLLGVEYIFGLEEKTDVVDLNEYKERFRQRHREQINKELGIEHDNGVDYIPNDNNEDNGLFSLNPRMHEKSKQRMDENRESARRLRDINFMRHYKLSYI